MSGPKAFPSPGISARRTGLGLILAAVVLATMLPGAAGLAGDTTFLAELVAAGDSGDCKALSDINGDGLDDAVVGGARLVWYASPDWNAKTVAVADEEFTTDMEAADVDGDGDIDLIVPDGLAGVYWFENQQQGAAWTRHFIAETGGKYCHDVAVGDIDGDGDLDVVGRPLNGFLHIFRQEAGGGWTSTSCATAGGEGLALADLDADGRLDIVVNGQWHAAPAGDIVTEGWLVHTYDAASLAEQTKVAVGDLNSDGRPDIALTSSEDVGEIAWYAAPADPTTNSWPKQVLNPAADHFHSLQLADMNGDGSLDLVTAQMHTAVTTPVVAIYLNPGAGEGVWDEDVIASASSHNLAVGDVDNDGRIDLLGCNFIGNPPVLVWINRTPRPSALPRTDRFGLSLLAAPTPFNARVVLTATTGSDRPAVLNIYDLRGRLVRGLLPATTLEQPRAVTWDGRDRAGLPVPAGVYFAVLSTGSEQVTRKLVLVE